MEESYKQLENSLNIFQITQECNIETSGAVSK